MDDRAKHHRAVSPGVHRLWRSGWLSPLLMAVIGVNLYSCADWPSQWRLFPSSAPASTDPIGDASPPALLPATAGDTDDEAAVIPPVYLLQIRFDILRARAPQGTFSGSGKIWNHLQEEVISSAKASMMQRNGIRAARGKVDAWPPIKALLDAVQNVQSSQSSMIVSNGLPLMIELEQPPRDQTLFFYREAGNLAGQSFPMSTNVLRVEYEIPADDPASVIVRASPEIRLRGYKPRFELTPQGWIEHSGEEPSRVLRELSSPIRLNGEEFLAIGPSAAATEGHLAGSLLLLEESQGQMFESMYFITPRVLRVPAVKPRGDAATGS